MDEFVIMKPASRRRPARVRPLSVRGRAVPSRAASLLPEALWSKMWATLPRRAQTELDRVDARSDFETLLRILRRNVNARTGSDSGLTSAKLRRLWKSWLADGTWIRLWKAYVEHLGPRAKQDWQRALMRSGGRLQARRNGSATAVAQRAWWLTSAAILEKAASRGARRLV